jgi:hypothetical protein
MRIFKEDSNEKGQDTFEKDTPARSDSLQPGSL